MIVAIIAIVVIIWKVATASVAYKVLDSTERFEAKRDEDIEISKWSRMWSNVDMFIEKFKEVNGGDYSGFYDIAFVNNIEMWIFSQYGYTLEDLKKSTKDKKQIKWYESVFRNGSMFNNTDIKEYKSVYSGKWIEDIKSRIQSDVESCNAQKIRLETKRKEECKTGIKEILTVIAFFVAVTIACQDESGVFAMITITIGLIYFWHKVPDAVRFFKDRKEYMEK